MEDIGGSKTYSKTLHVLEKGGVSICFDDEVGDCEISLRI